MQMITDKEPDLDADQYFAVIPEWVIQTVGPRALQVYALLRRHADHKRGDTFVGIKTLAREARASADTVRRAITELTEAGALTVTVRFDGDRQTTNLYTLIAVPPSKNATLPPGADAGVPPGKNAGAYISSQNDQSQTITLAKPRNEIWDAISSVLGEPSNGIRSLQGKTTKELQSAGLQADEVIRIMERIVRSWGPEKLTVASLAKHWSRFRDSTRAVHVTAQDRQELAQSEDRAARVRAMMEKAKGGPQ